MTVIRPDIDFEPGVIAGPPGTVRVLAVAERRGDGATAEPSSEKARLRAKLRDARAALADSLKARRVAMDLIEHLKEQLGDQ